MQTQHDYFEFEKSHRLDTNRGSNYQRIHLCRVLLKSRHGRQIDGGAIDIKRVGIVLE